MLKKENLKAYIDELIKEVEEELEEANVTGNVDGYQTPFAFSGKNGSQRRKKTATQLGYTLVDNDVENIDEVSTSFVSGNSGRTITNLDNKKYQLTKDVKGAQIGNYTNVVLPNGSIIHNLPGGVFVSHPSLKDKFSGVKEIPKFGFRVTTHPNTIVAIEKSSKILESVNEEKVYIDFLNKKKGFKQDRIKFNSYEDAVKWAKKNFDKFDRDMIKYESVNEGKLKRPVNRWLELKNDESMHANKKLAVGLKELKYQLSEVEKFFRWYNQIKTMNELSSDTFWKRTHGHIYKIKERLINIAKTIQEIEK